MGSQWSGMGRTMIELEIFRQSIHESSDVLQQFGINLYKIIMFGDENVYDKPLNSFIGITAIQVWPCDLQITIYFIILSLDHPETEAS